MLQTDQFDFEFFFLVDLTFSYAYLLKKYSCIFGHFWTRPVAQVSIYSAQVTHIVNWKTTSNILALPGKSKYATLLDALGEETKQKWVVTDSLSSLNQ